MRLSEQDIHHILEHALTEADHLLDIQRRATAFIAARLKADS